MGKCVDQVYFMKKWSKRQGLKIAISQQFSYVNFSMIIFSLLYMYICRFACQQRVLKTFPGPAYLCSGDGVV